MHLHLEQKEKKKMSNKDDLFQSQIAVQKRRRSLFLYLTKFIAVFDI
jgi:hypothetical protein